MDRSKNWCFTDFELLNFNNLYEQNKEDINYIGWGSEICPKTKKEHFQGFIQFSKRRRLNGVKKIFGTKKIHIEVCKGNELQNIKYCSKEGKYNKLGSFTIQGERTDINEIKEQIKNNIPMHEIAENNFNYFCKFHKAFYAYKKLLDEQKNKDFRKVEVVLISGPTGSGKTRRALYNDNDERINDIYDINGYSLNWFDGYNNEKTLLIDEYNNDVNITKLLKLLDGHRLRLDAKNTFVYAGWTKVIITTNLTLDELHFNAKPAHRDALKRRITKVINLWP